MSMKKNGSSFMRNGSSTTRKIGNVGRGRKRVNGNVIRAFFLVLILIVLALSATALYLTTKIGLAKEQQQLGVQQLLTSTARNAVAVPAPETGNVRFAAAAPHTSHEEGNAAPKENASQTNNNNAKKVALPYPAGPKTDPKYAKDRVYCMVPYVWNAEMYEVIMATWCKRCNVINFLADAVVLDHSRGKMQGDFVHHDGDADPSLYQHYSKFSKGTFPENVHFIEMSRPWTGCKDGKSGKPKVCRHIWEKMWRSWVYVGDHHLDQAEWFCKVDYDTYFFPENLQYYVRDYKGWDPYNEHHYFGLELAHKVKYGHPTMAAGAAACWSRKTMEGIAEVYRNMPKGYSGADRGRCEDRPQASEEISTSMCLLKGLNVTLEPMRDEENREYVMVDPYHNHLTWNRTEQGEWWYWEGKPKNVGQMEECCSHRPMGFHNYKQKWQIESLDQQFYGPSDNNELKKLNERTRRYANKVRRAMGIDK